MSARSGRERLAAYALTLFAFSALMACAERKDSRPSSDRRDGGVAVDLREVSRSGRLADRDIDESSGLTPSSSDSLLFWTHNDSGNDARLYAIDSTGKSLGSVRVRGATNSDWEGIASGPCPEGQCLYIADVGDNSAKRPLVVLWRVLEPRPRDVNSATAVRLAFRYPDGPQDVEAIYVSPDTSVWLLSKRPLRSGSGELRPVRVYRIPASAWSGGSAPGSGPVTAELVDSLPIVPEREDSRSWVTDAALSPARADGSRRLAVLTYGAIHVFRADPVTGRPGLLYARCALTIREKYAEAIAWLPDGRLLFSNEGKGAGVYTGRCP
ncbi:MAG: hypothetical protein IBJ03_00040 [Gemmatimonadaceae bacterium]|nr:hypothetical protein [Gemmatimonadaceae bacterium]